MMLKKQRRAFLVESHDIDVDVKESSVVAGYSLVVQFFITFEHLFC